MSVHCLLTSIGFCATMLIAPMGTSAASIAGAAKITDGDTVKIGGTNIRLNGIDAPETDQVCLDSSGMNYRCGIAARNALINLIGRKTLTCSGREVDVYGRRIMTCFVGDIDINAAMVAEGWALAFRRYSNVYVHQEREAKRRKSGLWSGAFIAPWDWRKRDQQTEILGALTVPLDAQKRLVPLPFESSSASTGCEIKGNISRKGVRIYHTPGQRDYDRTRITEGKGERWFCTEAEARAAGWRRARN